MLAIFVTTASAIVVEPSSEPSGSLPRRDIACEEASAGSPAVPGRGGGAGGLGLAHHGLLEVVPPMIAGAFVMALDLDNESE